MTLLERRGADEPMSWPGPTAPRWAPTGRAAPAYGAFMAYRFKPPVSVEIVYVPAPDAQSRLEKAIDVVATAIAERAWAETLAEEAETLAEEAAEEEARHLEALAAVYAASGVPFPKATVPETSSAPSRPAPQPLPAKRREARPHPQKPNAKNKIEELLTGQGLPLDLAVDSSAQDRTGALTSTVAITPPERVAAKGTGAAARKSKADAALAEDVLVKPTREQSADAEDWASMNAEAQAGDALLKLAGYLATELASPAERSLWRQRHESEGALARVFDRWLDEGAPDLALYGRGLGEKHKATVVGALIWRRYGARILGSRALEALRELRAALAT